MFDGLQDAISNWHHYVPFAALISNSGPIPENRPAMTRIIEQGFVGVVAAALGSYVTLQVNQTEINTLKVQRVEADMRTTAAIEASEARVTQQIVEMRAILLNRK